MLIRYRNKIYQRSIKPNYTIIGQPGTIDVKSEKSELEREELGMFSFDILTYSDASFAQQLPAGTQNRVGEPLHFAVVPENILSNLVYQTTACSILAADNSTSYVLFEDEKPDSWVNPMRYRPYYSDTNGGESCAVETQDKFSYTVFEFVDQTAEGLVTNFNLSFKRFL